MPKGKTVGPLDVYVGPNWAESLEGAVNQGLGGYMAGQANKEDRDIDKARQLEKTLTKEAADAITANEEGRANRTLAIAEEGLAEEKADAERVVMRSPDGKDEAQAVERNGILYEADGSTPWGRKGWTEYVAPTRSSGSRYVLTKGTDPNGNEVFMKFDKSTGDQEPFQFIDGTPYSEEKAGTLGQTKVEQGAAEKGAEATATDNVTQITKIEDGLNGMERTAVLYGQALDAMEEGAKTGYIEGNKWSPTVAGASIMLQNVQDQLGLEKIGEYTFGSLSEAEGQWVRDSSIPKTLDEDQIVPFLRHKYESQKRAIQAEKFELLYRKENGESPPRKYIDQILKRDGFEFGKEKSWDKEEEE
jgi:hypothetical protein